MIILNLTDSKKFPHNTLRIGRAIGFKITVFFSESCALNFTVFRLTESFQQEYRGITTDTPGVYYFELFSVF